MSNKNLWKGTVLFLILSILPWSLASGQEIVFPELSRFEIDTGYPVYTADNLWDHINGGADAYNALGFRDLHIAEYQRGKHSIKVEIYHHAGENLAFGIYAMERAPSYDFFKLGVQAYREDGLIHFFKGEYYVKLTSHSDNKKVLSALEDLAYMTENMLEGTAEFPEELKLFPAEGKQENTEMYIAENVMGHEFLNNAFRADYNASGNRFTIYLFTENTDEQNHEILKKYLSIYGLSPGDGPGEKFYFEDGYNGFVYLAWEEGLLILLSGLDEGQMAMANDYIGKILSRHD